MAKKNKLATIGKGLDKGHGGNTKNLPSIVEYDDETALTYEWQMRGWLQLGTKVYKMGQCRIFVSPPNGKLGWHMSISHPKRYPSWDEVAKARYELIPNEITMVMVLPPKEEYINIHNFCFQLHEEK